ncbi:MAG: hypothetical protein ACK53Y_05140, partial [bacterium]
SKEQRTKTFLVHTHKIAQAFIFFEKIDTILLTNLDDTSFTTWTTLYFLKEIDDLVPEVGEPFFYQDYLQTDLQDAVNILLKDFTSYNLAGENKLERRIRNDNEKAFQKKVIKKLLETILPVTIYLQTTIDREEKIKKNSTHHECTIQEECYYHGNGSHRHCHWKYNSQQLKYGAIPKEISGRCHKFQS